MVAFFASTDAVQTPETTDARARVVADGKPRAILSRRFRRTAETRRRRRHRDDDGGLKTKIISIHSHRHRFRSSTRRWRRRARTRVARSAASSPERSQVRFAVVVVVVVVGSSSRTHHEAILAHGARLHRDGVGRAGIGAFEGFNVVLVVRHGECVEVQSGAGGRE